MSEPVWYFAQGEAEQGPVTQAQLQKLLATGKIAPHDLVWKEGMDDWAPARDVSELKAALNPQSDSASSKTGQTPSRPAQDLIAFNLGGLLARPLILFGLLLVVMTHGCEFVGSRSVTRAQALALAAEQEFQHTWDQRKAELQSERDKLLAGPRNPAEQDRADELGEQIIELDASMQVELQRLRTTRWRELETNAREAELKQQMWAYWQALFFVLATMILSVGLVVMSLQSSGQETTEIDKTQRWMCWAMLLVIIASIYFRLRT